MAPMFGPFQPIPAAPAAAGGGAPNALNVSVDHTVPSNWCWAAVASAIGNFYNRPKSPCEVATESLGTDCCNPPVARGSDPRNTDWGLDQPLASVGQTLPHTDGPLSPTDILTEITDQHPICCHILWPDGSTPPGHYIIVVGCNPAAGTVDVRDNRYGDKNGLPYITLVTAYGSPSGPKGSWDVTYKTSTPQ
jgi:Papain-like cysteine protease AvrRpt2